MHPIKVGGALPPSPQPQLGSNVVLGLGLVQWSCLHGAQMSDGLLPQLVDLLILRVTTTFCSLWLCSM